MKWRECGGTVQHDRQAGTRHSGSARGKPGPTSCYWDKPCFGALPAKRIPPALSMRRCRRDYYLGLVIAVMVWQRAHHHLRIAERAPLASETMGARRSFSRAPHGAEACCKYDPTSDPAQCRRAARAVDGDRADRRCPRNPDPSHPAGVGKPARIVLFTGFGVPRLGRAAVGGWGSSMPGVFEASRSSHRLSLSRA
jgi:hypothetical protein